ncbi:MAG: hypothetical protein COA79_05530 [Planctomycetota bacterium]|nr:MAG: hypothetical protein COA79_05530 [Planctomycetota bacterium]
MVQSKAKTIPSYLKEITPQNKKLIQEVREVILKNIDPLFEENMNWGMISYEIPLKIYPDTYNKKPLMYMALAAQKNNISLYLMCTYQNEKLNDQLLKGFDNIDKKPNMGKSCIRFKQTEDIPLKVIGKIIKKITLKKFIKNFEEAISSKIRNCD